MRENNNRKSTDNNTRNRRRAQRDGLDEIALDIGDDVRSIKNGSYDRKKKIDEIKINTEILDGIQDERYYDREETAPDYNEYAEAQPAPRKKKSRNKMYAFISYVFVLIFLSLIGYIVYFNVNLRGDILNSPYNKRQDAFAEYVSRGPIKSADGVVLAQTETDAEGNEKRVYPYANEYAHIVGYATKGKAGIEFTSNYDLLTSHENTLNQIKNELFNQKNPGDSVITTLDSRLQDAAYSALGEWKGAVVVIDVKTGAIKAMVSKPDFDPNSISEMWDTYINDATSSVLVNRATQGRYAPGSTFKIVTALAYYKKYGTFDGFNFNCEGTLTSEGHTVHCFEGNAHGPEDFKAAFENSCNCAFSNIGLNVGSAGLRDTAELLLFNKALPTPDINYNKSSFTLEADAGDPIIMQTAFGQGQTLTSPYHMALIVSAIANNGNLMTPYVIDRIEDCYGNIVSTTKVKAYKNLMSTEEAEVLKELMRSVVTNGTAQLLNNDIYSAAGKTGSAEYNNSDGSIGTHSWFVGFSNVEDPDIVVAVIAEGAGSGSGTAVPIAKTIFDTYYSMGN